MSRTTVVIAFLAAIAGVPALAAGQGTGNEAGQARRVYREQDPATNTTLTATTDREGNAVVTLKGGDFTLEKVMASTGVATLRLSQGRDVVTIAINHAGFEVARGQKSARIDPRSDRQDKLDAVRAMLVGSQAIKSFKRLVASLEQRDEGEEDGALAVNALVDGAVVLLLDGDADAPRRLAKRLTRKQRGGVRVARAKALPGVFVDCIGLYEVALLTAWGQFESCYLESRDYSFWTRDFIAYLCEWEWIIRAEQYVFQFIGCTLIPW
jgi:hypothetical protein